MNRRIGVALGVALAMHGGAGAFAGGAPVVAIKASKIHTMTGPAFGPGVVLVRDGHVAAVGRDVAIPDGAQIIELPDAVVTPGLIDAHAFIDSEVLESRGRSGLRRRQVSFWEELGARAAAQGAGTTAAQFAASPEGYPLDPSRCPHEGLADLCEGICPHCGTPLHHADEPAAVIGTPMRTTAENSSEITPHLRILDSTNLLSSDFERLLRSGVTTVWLSPDSASVVGMQGAVVKTGGALATRVVEPGGAVKATMGADSFRRGARNRTPTYSQVSFMTRRPTTRMGAVWVFRKAFYDALRFAESGAPIGGADTPPAAALPVLLRILSGETPLRVQARMQHDILTAIRLADEFGLGFAEEDAKARRLESQARWSVAPGAVAAAASAAKRVRPPFILEEATEAYKCLGELKAAGVPVVFGPIFDQPQGFRAVTGEANDPRINTARQLYDAKIPFALTAHDLRDEDGLVRQAMIATRNGLSADVALRSITSAPAEIMGLSGRVGTLADGADADVVVWNTEPLDAASRVMLVMIDGQVVYDEREKSE